MLFSKKSIVKALINKFTASNDRIDVAKSFPLSKGEDAVVLAQASYKCGVRVHPVGLNTVMLNLFQQLTSMKLPLLAGQILNQVQDDAVIGGVPC